MLEMQLNSSYDNVWVLTTDGVKELLQLGNI